MRQRGQREEFARGDVPNAVRVHRARRLCHRVTTSVGGFTLIEILVVVVIIAMLAVIGVLQLTRVRMTAREQLAVVSVKTIARSCQLYFSINNTYPADLSALVPPTANPAYLNDQVDVDGRIRKQGYEFKYTRVDVAHFQILANPLTIGQTGSRSLLIDETDSIRHCTTGAAAATEAELIDESRIEEPPTVCD